MDVNTVFLTFLKAKEIVSHHIAKRRFYGQSSLRRSRGCGRNILRCFFVSKRQQYGVQWHEPVFSQVKGIVAASSKRFGMDHKGLETGTMLALS